MEIDDRLLAANAGNASALRNQGVAWYQRGLKVWVDPQKKGMLIPMYAPKMDDAIKNVARCDVALGGGK